MLNNCCLKESNILIYGTGGNGIGLYQRLASFYNILGFIDKRAAKIVSIFDKPVYTIRDISQKLSFAEKENTVVIITIKNVFDHSGLVKELLYSNFPFIIYKPLNILKNRGNETDIRVNAIYESIVEKKQYASEVLVPRTEDIEYKLANRLLIERKDNEVITWLPVESLFNYKNSYGYPGINMPLFFPLVELYKAFLGKRDVSLQQAINNFYLYCGEWLYQNGKTLTDEQKDSFLEARRSVYVEMQKTAEVDIDFFKRNAPSVEKEENRFYLKSSGRNRISFLIAKGFRYVPVKMRIVDYEEWCDIEFVREKEKSINQNNVKCFFAPYPNPYLVDYSVCFVDYQRLFLQPIANEITKEIYLNNVITEAGVNRVAHEHVESDKKKWVFALKINDEGIAEEYLKNIGFLTVCSYMQNHNAMQILVLDSQNFSEMEEVLAKGRFNKVYYLQQGMHEDTIEKFQKCGYKLEKKMFESVCRNGIICGFSFIFI